LGGYNSKFGEPIDVTLGLDFVYFHHMPLAISPLVLPHFI